MAARKFRELLEAKWNEGKCICVGLDSDPAKLPQVTVRHDEGSMILVFNRAIVDATKDLVCAYKLNPAFYESMGDSGRFVFCETIEYIREKASDVPIILDAKYGDIRNTNEKYAQSAFDEFRVDAVTVHPYLGEEALKPFLDRKEKGVFVLCRTSNPGAGEIQDLVVNGRPLYEYIARRVAWTWNRHGNCGVVVGATVPTALRAVRKIIGEVPPILIPGIGAQGGDLGEIIGAGKNSHARGMILTASRSILFASRDADFAEAARREMLNLHHQIIAGLNVERA